MTYFTIPSRAFTLWAGPTTQAAKRIFPGKVPAHAPLAKRSRDATRFRSAVQDILSGIEILETEHGYRYAWKRIGNLREHFNLSECYHSWAGGYMDATTARWYRDKVEFLYIMPDGAKVAYSKPRGQFPLATEEQKAFIHALNSDQALLASGHFWIKSGRVFN